MYVIGFIKLIIALTCYLILICYSIQGDDYLPVTYKDWVHDPLKPSYVCIKYQQVVCKDYVLTHHMHIYF